jgi:hypothetical protein
MYEQASAQIVAQRIRNRIIEYFSIVAEFPANRGALSLSSLINNWEMCVSRPLSLEDFSSRVFVPSEVDSVFAVDAAWESFADATPTLIRDESLALAQHEWRTLVNQCVLALAVFDTRGRLPEDIEVTNDA